MISKFLVDLFFSYWTGLINLALSGFFSFFLFLGSLIWSNYIVFKFLLKDDDVKIFLSNKLDGLVSHKKNNNASKFNGIMNFIGKLFVFGLFSIVLLELISFALLNLDPNYAADYRDIKKFGYENYQTMFYTFLNPGDVHRFILDFYDSYKARYHPYLGYEIEPYSGKYINMLDGGIRNTINPCASNGSIKIWFFGGSTAMGYLAADNQTIPSFISKNLCDADLSVNITNYGMHGYQSTQELVKLLLLLNKEEDYPDLVIFYDGINEIYSMYQNGDVGLPLNLENRYEEFNTRDEFNILRPIYKKSYTINFLNKYIIKQPPAKFILEGKNLDNLSYSIVDHYLDNMDMARSLTKEKNIKFIAVWQPMLFDRDRYYGQEGEIADGTDPILRDLILLTSGKMQNNNEEVLVLSDLFDDSRLDGYMVL